MKYKVRVRSVKFVDVEVEAEDDIDAEDAAADLYYRGDLSFGVGSPFLETKILEKDGERVDERGS